MSTHLQIYLFWCCSNNHTCRIEYDAYRTDLEELNLGPRDANTLPKIEQSQEHFQIYREKYERMRNDVSIKLKFLEENKVWSRLIHLYSLQRIFFLFSSSALILPLLRFPSFHTGESIAQPAHPVSQCHSCILCWKPTAAGTNTEAVPHQVENAWRRQSILAGTALITPFEAVVAPSDRFYRNHPNPLFCQCSSNFQNNNLSC